MKIRIAFILFIIVSVTSLFFYNHMQGGLVTDYSKKVLIIVYIFVITCICITYIVYEAYNIMYSEMKERMNMLTASKNDLQTTYDSISMFMIEVGSDYKIKNINKAVCKYADLKSSQIVGKNLEMILDIEESAMDLLKKSINETFAKNINGKTEVETVGKIFEAFTFPLQDSSEKLKKVLLVLNEVTQARVMNRQMLQDNKMVAVGQLAAGVAHEIRNPLGLIVNYCHLLKISPIEDQDVRAKAIFMIEKAANRASEIIENLLKFSRISNETWKEINISKSLQSIVSLEKHIFLKNNVEIVINCEDNISISVILESFEIILINLLLNAVDAMKNGGEIQINCIKDGDWVEIAVTDTGEGIADDIKASIFNPFFTTKENRNGCGLGLYIVYSEINKLGGKITVASKLGQGTTFTVQLPLKRREE